MKSIAYTALHYGVDFLAWAVRSVQDAVDEIHILYSDHPSFGFKTSLGCPDREGELQAEANRFLKKPLFWHKGHWNQEAAHRETILGIANDRGVDRILVLDADEVWPEGLAKSALESSMARSEKDVLMRMSHFWRSFNWVCHDPCMPVRILNPKGSGTWYLDPQPAHILHFGYAQNETVTRYKIDIHGHRQEWRSDWWDSKFMAWTPGNGMTDVHPTNHNFWTPEKTNESERKLLDGVLKDHPYYALDIIR